MAIGNLDIGLRMVTHTLVVEVVVWLSVFDNLDTYQMCL